jgi:enoyl-CoA hydratase/carnithine racemase
MELTKDGNVYVLTLHEGESRINPEFAAAFHAALDTVEQAERGPTALILTSTGKFLSNGLDQQWMLANVSNACACLEALSRLMARLITFGVPVVAAINGHCFAGGCLLAQSCDYRVMRTGAGFLCMNELELRSELPPAFATFLAAKMGNSNFAQTMLEAKRWTAETAFEAGLVDAAVPPEDLMSTALNLAESHAKRGRNKDVYAKLKNQIWGARAKELMLPIVPTSDFGREFISGLEIANARMAAKKGARL